MDPSEWLAPRLVAVGVSVVGFYANVVLLRATRRSTLLPRSANRLLSFFSVFHILLALANVFSAVARMTMSGFSLLMFVYILPLEMILLAPLWLTADRLVCHYSAPVRDKTPSSYVTIFRVAVLLHWLLSFVGLMWIFEQLTPDSKSPYFDNFLLDVHCASVATTSFLASLLLRQLIKIAQSRAGLLGGLKNEAKLQGLQVQASYLQRSHWPIVIQSILVVLLLIGLQRTVVSAWGTEALQEFHALVCTLPPLLFPFSVVVFHKHLRGDYLANVVVCRKARNVHRASKVKVIATRESQESIIANLKMIGILSDVDISPLGVKPSTPSTSRKPRERGASIVLPKPVVAVHS